MEISNYDIARFWSKVDVRDKSECWEWKAHILHNGYGAFAMGTGHVKAHRFAYMVMVGEIPDGLRVCHSCDNPKCVNPGHLWLGTQADNNADRDAKGRRAVLRGTANGVAILDEVKVREIRERYATGRTTMVQLGREYGVHDSTIARIISRQNWKWVE